MKLTKVCQYCGKTNKHKNTCKIICDEKQKEKQMIDDKMMEENRIIKEKEEKEQHEIDEVTAFFDCFKVEDDDVRIPSWESYLNYNVGPPPPLSSNNCYPNTAS